tara:strand:+ start:712 stop:1017 length:306 start_codon:yes stop_codon:yes gene_type:complete
MTMKKKPRNYKKEYANYQGTAEQKKNRATRNAARNTMKAKGVVSTGDGKHVNHKTPISRGGGNSPSNLSVKKESTNSSYPRTRSGAMKKAKRGGTIRGRKK